MVWAFLPACPYIGTRPVNVLFKESQLLSTYQHHPYLALAKMAGDSKIVNASASPVESPKRNADTEEPILNADELRLAQMGANTKIWSCEDGS